MTLGLVGRVWVFRGDYLLVQLASHGSGENRATILAAAYDCFVGVFSTVGLIFESLPQPFSLFWIK